MTGELEEIDKAAKLEKLAGQNNGIIQRLGQQGVKLDRVSFIGLLVNTLAEKVLEPDEVVDLQIEYQERVQAQLKEISAKSTLIVPGNGKVTRPR